MPSVKFVNEKKTIEVPVGANLRREALKAGIELYPGIHRVLNCHGLGQCASCCVKIKKGKENVSPQDFKAAERGRSLFLGHESIHLDAPARVAILESKPAVAWQVIVSGADCVRRACGDGLPNNGGGLRLTVRLQFPAPQSGG